VLAHSSLAPQPLPSLGGEQDSGEGKVTGLQTRGRSKKTGRLVVRGPIFHRGRPLAVSESSSLHCTGVCLLATVSHLAHAKESAPRLQGLISNGPSHLTSSFPLLQSRRQPNSGASLVQAAAL